MHFYVRYKLYKYYTSECVKQAFCNNAWEKTGWGRNLPELIMEFCKTAFKERLNNYLNA